MTAHEAAASLREWLRVRRVLVFVPIVFLASLLGFAGYFLVLMNGRADLVQAPLEVIMRATWAQAVLRLFFTVVAYAWFLWPIAYRRLAHVGVLFVAAELFAVAIDVAFFGFQDAHFNRAWAVQDVVCACVALVVVAAVRRSRSAA